MTDEELARIEALWSEAVPGPWTAAQAPGCGAMRFILAPEVSWHRIVAILENPGAFDADKAIAAARTDVPALVAEVRAQREHVAALTDAALDLVIATGSEGTPDEVRAATERVFALHRAWQERHPMLRLRGDERRVLDGMRRTPREGGR